MLDLDTRGLMRVRVLQPSHLGTRLATQSVDMQLQSIQKRSAAPVRCTARFRGAVEQRCSVSSERGQGMPSADHCHLSPCTTRSSRPPRLRRTHQRRSIRVLRTFSRGHRYCRRADAPTSSRARHRGCTKSNRRKRCRAPCTGAVVAVIRV